MTGRTHAGFRRKATSKRTTGTPRPWTFQVSGQVSWLTGRRLCLAFPVQRPVALSTVARRSQLRGQRRSWHSIWSIAPASLLASKPHATRKTLTSANWRQRAGKSMVLTIMHRAGTFSVTRHLAFRLHHAQVRPWGGMGDSPNPQMRVHAAPSSPVDMLQVSVLTAKKCRFHAPRGQDANKRVA